MSSNLEAALAYIKLGFRVFPVKPDKTPLTTHGLKDATQTQLGVKEYWGRWPNAGIGLVTDGYTVLDFDKKSGGLESKTRLEAEHEALPRTRAHQTGGGGLHLIYRNPNGAKVRNTVALAGYPGIDLRGNGGYIVAPPSLHQSGTRYEVVDDSEIAPVPAWLLELTTKKQAVQGETIPTGQPIAEGQRNATLASMAGSMRRRDMPQAAIEAALLQTNRERCQLPLPDTEVLSIAQSVSRYQPATQKTVQATKPEPQPRPPLIVISEVTAEIVKWLWSPYIPYGKLSLLEGDPGVGKSWVSLAIATAISRGMGLPGQTEVGHGPVLIASAEDGIADTIKPRLVSMGADESAIHAVDGLFTLDELGFTMLDDYVAETAPVLLIIDPLVAYLSGDLDINKANQVRFATARLAALAEKWGLAILAIRHLTKGGSSKAIYRGLGSIDFTAAARSVLMAGANSDDENDRGILHIKSNLAPMGQPVGYELRDGGFYWKQTCTLTYEAVTAIADKGPLDEAVDFLQDMLSTGETLATEVMSQARQAGIAEHTLRRAKEKLQVMLSRRGEPGVRGGGKSYWQLPKNEDLHGQ